jgi:hypothetical protein
MHWHTPIPVDWSKVNQWYNNGKDHNIYFSSFISLEMRKNVEDCNRSIDVLRDGPSYFRLYKISYFLHEIEFLMYDGTPLLHFTKSNFNEDVIRMCLSQGLTRMKISLQEDTVLNLQEELYGVTNNVYRILQPNKESSLILSVDD